MDDIKRYIIGVLLFGLVIVGGVGMLGTFFAKDSTFGDSQQFKQYNKTFNKLDEVNSQVSNLQSNVEGSASSELDIFGVIPALVNSAWSTLSIILSSFGFMTSAYSGLSTFFGIPAFIPVIIGSIITVMIIFALYRALFQRS